MKAAYFQKVGDYQPRKGIASPQSIFFSKLKFLLFWNTMKYMINMVFLSSIMNHPPFSLRRLQLQIWVAEAWSGPGELALGVGYSLTNTQLPGQPFGHWALGPCGLILAPATKKCLPRRRLGSDVGYSRCGLGSCDHLGGTMATTRTWFSNAQAADFEFGSSDSASGWVLWGLVSALPTAEWTSSPEAERDDPNSKPSAPGRPLDFSLMFVSQISPVDVVAWIGTWPEQPYFFIPSRPFGYDQV